MQDASHSLVVEHIPCTEFNLDEKNWRGHGPIARGVDSAAVAAQGLVGLPSSWKTGLEDLVGKGRAQEGRAPA